MKLRCRKPPHLPQPTSSFSSSHIWIWNNNIGRLFLSLLCPYFSPCQHVEHHCRALVPPKKNRFLAQRHHPCCARSRCSGAISCRCESAFAWIHPSPPAWTLRGAMVRQSGICGNQQQASADTASKLAHQAGAPSAGRLGEESTGSPTTVGEAVSQNEWLVSAGQMIRFALTLSHFAVYRYHREKWH